MSEEIKLNYDPVVTVAVADRYESKTWENVQCKLSDLYARFNQCMVTPETQAEFFRLKGGSKADKDKATKIKGAAGGFVGGQLDETGRRQRENVINRTLYTADIDSGIPLFGLGSGISFARYTTHSHSASFPRFRIIAPLSRPVTADEYERFSRLYAWVIADMLGVDPAAVFTDDTMHSPEHMMFWPTASKDGPFDFYHQDGAPIDVDAILDTDREGFYLKTVKPAGQGIERAAGEKVPVGQRYKHLISRAQTLVNKMCREFTDDAILSALWQIAHDECEGEIDGEDFNAFCEVYRPSIESARRDYEDYDYSAAVGKFYAANPGDELPKKADGKTDWGKVREIAENAPAMNAAVNNSDTPLREEIQLLPADWGDIDQGRLFAKLYGNRVLYADGYGWLTYSGTRWESNEHKAMYYMQHLTDRQLQEAKKRFSQATNDDDLKAANNLNRAVIQRRNDKKMLSAMAQAVPLLHIKESELDAKPFLLNTPAGTVDLRTGIMQEHDPNDYLMKITGCSPSTEGAADFEQFLKEITDNDNDLKHYLQTVAGMCAIGKVFKEALMIAYGRGGNGKSTFFNLLWYVLGDYSGKISSSVLVTGKDKEAKAELAELKGKRFVIAAELGEGTRLNTGVIKNLCSTDPIQAEKKYKDPFTYTPSHHVVLYTNNLPKVGSTDSGTWDRLIVIPFKGRFRNTEKEIPNYADVLFQKVGGACLQWIIDGARIFIDNGYKLTSPACVVEAIAEYEQNNDWVKDFVETYCETQIDYYEQAGYMYAAYQQFCTERGERALTSTAFKIALEGVGFIHKRQNTGSYYWGLHIKPSKKQEILIRRAQ